MDLKITKRLQSSIASFILESGVMVQVWRVTIPQFNLLCLGDIQRKMKKLAFKFGEIWHGLSFYFILFLALNIKPFLYINFLGGKNSLQIPHICTDYKEHFFGP